MAAPAYWCWYLYCVGVAKGCRLVTAGVGEGLQKTGIVKINEPPNLQRKNLAEDSRGSKGTSPQVFKGRAGNFRETAKPR